MKVAVRVEGFTLPMATVSECVLGLLVSFSTMQGCSEPVALQMHQQGSFLIFPGRKLRNVDFFCNLAPKYHCVYLCFHACLELHFSCYSKIMGAGWGESEELYSRYSHLIWSGLGQKCPRVWKQLLLHIICAYTGWEKSPGCWGCVMAHVLLLSLFSCPRMGSCAEVWPMGAPWEIWSRRCPNRGWPYGLRRPWLLSQLVLAAQPSTYMLHLQPKPSHTCLDFGLEGLCRCGSEVNLRRGLWEESHPWWDSCFSEGGLDLRLPFPGCGVGRTTALPEVASSVFSYTFRKAASAAPKMLLLCLFRRHLKVPLNSSVHLQYSETTHKYPC